MCTPSILFADSSIALPGHTLDLCPPPPPPSQPHRCALLFWSPLPGAWQQSGSALTAVVSALMGEGPHQGFQG